MRAVSLLVVSALAVIVLAAPAAVLADRRVGTAGGQQHICTHRPAAEPGQRRGGHVGGAASARFRGDERAGCRPARVDRGAASVHAAERRGGRLSGLLRRPWHRDGGVNYLSPVDARLERVDVRFDGDDRRPSCLDVTRVVGSHDPQFMTEQPAGSLNAAYGGDPHGERRQPRRPERGPAGRRGAGGVCGGGTYDGGGWARPEQPVHGGAAGASGDRGQSRLFCTGFRWR